MKVTVSAMRMMQVAIDQIVHMVTMRNLLVPASGAVDMASIVSGTSVIRCTLGRIRHIDLQYMFINMRTVNMVQMAVVQIIGMAIVVYG